jgi:hypothetical protein
MVWTYCLRLFIYASSIAWAFAEFVIARRCSFSSEFGFLSVVPALINKVPQVRTLKPSAPRSCCDFILANNAPVATHIRVYSIPSDRSRTRHF